MGRSGGQAIYKLHVPITEANDSFWLSVLDFKGTCILQAEFHEIY